MCGFAGFINCNRNNITETLFNMTDEINHRGPDDEGFGLFSLSNQKYKKINRNNKITNSDFQGGVGFKRLSIIDLSNAGHQPMMSDDGNIIIIFNGEIYNAVEISEKLQKEGCKFKGHSDTEVLLNLYEKKGLKNLLNEIDGMYSIVIIDLKLKRFSLIRDHVGIKPLYYYSKGDIFLFASEVKSFYKHPQFVKVFDKEKLSEFLYYRCLTNNDTMLKNVKQVPPGSVLNINEHGKIEKFKYYTLPIWKKSKKNQQFKFSGIIKESIKSQLISDAPLGCQLSGGIDSSIICKLANEEKINLESFSVIFKDTKYSEEKYINLVKDKLSLKCQKFMISEDFFIDNLEKSTWHLDDPIHHPNSLGILYLTKNASKYVKVLLSGEGADEMFGGYSRFLYSNLPFKFLIKIIRFLNNSMKIPILKNIGYKINEIENFILMSSAGDARDTKKLFPFADLQKTITKRTKIFNENKDDYFLNKCIDYEIKTYLPSLLLRQDKMAMANSLENRVPFLGRKFIEDSRLNLNAESCVSVPYAIPSRYNVMKGTKKPLKKISEIMFGKEFTYRPKQGFGIPIVHFLQNQRLSKNFHDKYKISLIKHTELSSKIIDNVWQSRTKYPEQAFTLLSLGIWLKLNLDN